MLLYRYLARAFEAEGVRHVFGLMGDGNMHWMSAVASSERMRVVSAMHEAVAVTMADGYARASGTVGVASVTCGPGISQITTQLLVAQRHGTPLVVFAGDTPQSSRFHLQAVDVAALAAASDTPVVRVASVEDGLDATAEAFRRARTERRPVLLTVPYDLQRRSTEWDPVLGTSDDLIVRPSRSVPVPSMVDEICQVLERSERIVVLAGAGAVDDDCRDQLVGLAEDIDAVLATTLRGIGLFDGHRYNIGVVGAFSTDAARTKLALSDCVLAVGARLGYYTTEAGYIFPNATVIQVDNGPSGFAEGQRTADLLVRGDGAPTVAAIRAALGRRERVPSDQSWRSLTAAAGEGDAELDPGEGVAHPVAFVRAADRAIPSEANIVVGAGHSWNYVVPNLSGRHPSSYHFTYDFGVVGQGVGTALGVALARPDRPTFAFEGDGGVLMNLSVLDTISRHRIPVMVLIINDGAYGAEYHKLRSQSESGQEALFGWSPFEGIARSFGLDAATPTSAEEIADHIAKFCASPRPYVLDLRVDHRLISEQYRRLYLAKEQ